MIKYILKNKIIKKIICLSKKETRYINNINYKQLKEMQNEDYYLIDIRSPQEYKEGHLEGAYNIPLYNIKKDINKVIKSKEMGIIVYCTAGTRSIKAVNILQKNGYYNVYNLEGGLDNIDY